MKYVEVLVDIHKVQAFLNFVSFIKNFEHCAFLQPHHFRFLQSNRSLPATIQPE